jgi:hypothetical protein
MLLLGAAGGDQRADPILLSNHPPTFSKIYHQAGFTRTPNEIMGELNAYWYIIYGYYN